MPQEVSAELRRVTDRWAQLPLATAEARMPLARALLAELAELSGAAGPVPDLGPAVVADQIMVLLYDACAAGRVATLEQRLSELRRSL